MLICDCSAVREKELLSDTLKCSYISYKRRFKSCLSSFLWPEVFGLFIELATTFNLLKIKSRLQHEAS